MMINNYCCWWAKPRGHFFFQWEGMEVLRVELGLESTHVRGRRLLLLWGKKWVCDGSCTLLCQCITESSVGYETVPPGKKSSKKQNYKTNKNVTKHCCDSSVELLTFLLSFSLSLTFQHLLKLFKDM